MGCLRGGGGRRKVDLGSLMAVQLVVKEILGKGHSAQGHSFAELAGSAGMPL